MLLMATLVLDLSRKDPLSLFKRRRCCHKCAEILERGEVRERKRVVICCKYNVGEWYKSGDLHFAVWRHIAVFYEAAYAYHHSRLYGDAGDRKTG